MDNAYENQQGDQFPYFRTGDPINNPDPSGAGQFTNDSATTWDIRLSALNTFLQGTSPVFYFNHNQTGAAGGGGFASTEDLFVWAQVILRNDAGAVIAVYDFTSVAPNNFGNPGGNVGSYNSPGLATSTNPTTGAGAGFPDIDDFVHARGKICFDGPHGVATSNIIPCDANQDGQADAGVVDIVDMNLGANNVANAIIFPELNAFLAAGAGGATTLQIDFRMGCNAAIQPCPAGSVLNNGFEQLFIVAGVTTTTVPEPGTLALAGLLLLGMVGISRHRRQR
jgi:hypothetical protein